MAFMLITPEQLEEEYTLIVYCLVFSEEQRKELLTFNDICELLKAKNIPVHSDKIEKILETWMDNGIVVEYSNQEYIIEKWKVNGSRLHL